MTRVRVRPGQMRGPNLGAPRLPPFHAPSWLSMPSPYTEAPDVFVHPDVVHAPGGWNGYEWWMGVTPYPSDAQENPSILASNDRVTWEVPPGLTNPVAPNTGGYNSDPDLVLHNDTLHLFYRQKSVDEKIWLRTSTDGVVWSSAQLLITSSYMLSPAVVRATDGTWWMYYVTDPGTGRTIGYRTAPAATAPWSAEAIATYPIPTYGQTGVHNPWHVDAFDHGGLHYLLINEDTQGGHNLRFAVSSDRTTFTPAASPVMAQQSGGWDGVNPGLYRSTCRIRPTGDLIWLWYSAHGEVGWRVGYTEIPVAGNLPTL